MTTLEPHEAPARSWSAWGCPNCPEQRSAPPKYLADTCPSCGSHAPAQKVEVVPVAGGLVQPAEPDPDVVERGAKIIAAYVGPEPWAANGPGMDEAREHRRMLARAILAGAGSDPESDSGCDASADGGGITPAGCDPEKEALRAAAETAVFALLPLLPLSGSDQSGYKPNETTSSTYVAEPEEWLSAAHAIAELHAALAGCADTTEPDLIALNRVAMEAAETASQAQDALRDIAALTHPTAVEALGHGQVVDQISGVVRRVGMDPNGETDA